MRGSTGSWPAASPTKDIAWPSSTCLVTGSDKPPHATQHRLDRYARQVVALLEELGVERAVVGGVSLGANVSLHVAVQAPERVAALLVEMPVLEWATPAAASLFVPLLLAVSFGRRLFGWTASILRRLPRTGNDALDSVLGTLSMEPEAIAAVLHGLLVGPSRPRSSSGTPSPYPCSSSVTRTT